VKKYLFALFLSYALAFALFGVLFLTSGCSVKIKSDPVRVNPVIVKHQIDTSAVEEYYQAACKHELAAQGLYPSDPAYAAAQEACVDERVSTWVSLFNEAVN
jgi:hypothetical protein